MKTKLRALFVLLVLCMFLAAAFMLLPSGRPAPNFGARVNQEDAVIIITDIHVGDVYAMALTNRQGYLGIINNPEEIIVISDMDGSFNNQEMRALIYLSANLPALRSLDNFSIPTEEDIENSLARFTLILNGGFENNFAIIQQSPVSNDYVLFFVEQQSMYLISPSTAEWFLRNPEDYIMR